MSTEVVMPQMGESITEGTLTKWLKKPGDTVQRDEPLFEISTDKVDAEIPSPAAGTLESIKIEEGTTVTINTVVCTIAEAGSTSNGAGGKATAAPAETAGAPAVDSATPAAVDFPAANETPEQPSSSLSGNAQGGDAQAGSAQGGGAAGAGTDVPMPQMGESITEGTITKWLKKIGDSVQRDEPLFEISTDKVDAEIPSPVAGVLTEIKVQEGATVTINTVVAVIGGASASKPNAEAGIHGSESRHGAPAPVVPASAAAPAASASEGERLRSSPLVRKMAKENNVDLAQVPGTGASGRITKQDMVGHLEGGAKPAATSTAASAAPAASTPVAPPLSAAAASAPPQASAVAAATSFAAASPTKPIVPAPMAGELVPMTKMRAIIAKRMVESKQTSPHVHTVFKVDMTRIVRLREKEKAKYEQRNGVKLTYMPFITRAAIVALKKHPVVNGSIEGDAIRYNKNVNIGIAVALDWGLIVPVIKQTEEKSFLGIARSIVDVAERARGKKLAPDEISGGTFTLTNSGIFGEQFGTPIINQPQSAILGIGGLNKEAEVITDKDGSDMIAIRSIQRFTLGFDHRIVDGADAGKFMSDFKAYLENWAEDIG